MRNLSFEIYSFQGTTPFYDVGSLNNIIIEILRVADDACKEGLSATRYVFYQELFKVLVDILTPQVCRICQQVSRQSQGIWAWRF